MEVVVEGGEFGSLTFEELIAIVVSVQSFTTSFSSM